MEYTMPINDSFQSQAPASAGPKTTSDEPKSIGQVLEQRQMPPELSSEAAASRDAEIARDEAAAAARRRNQRIEDILRRLAAAAGERRAKESRFGSWETKSDYQAKAKAAVQRWADEWTERQAACEGLVLYGPCGAGKDHMAFAATRQVVIQHGEQAGWLNGRELAAKARQAITDEAGEAWLNEYLRATLLVVSDPLPVLGELTPYQADMLYRVYETRDGRGLVTITTLNVADDHEADRRLGAPTWDRVCHRAWKICCRWPTHRKPVFELKPE